MGIQYVNKDTTTITLPDITKKHYNNNTKLYKNTTIARLCIITWATIMWSGIFDLCVL